VFDHEPAIPFDLVAIVEVQSSRWYPSAEGALAAARIRACELGGDALVLLYRAGDRRRRSPGRRMLPEADVRGAVVRYRR